MAQATFFIAEALDDRFLGLIGVMETSTLIGPVAYIPSMYVTPGERGAGTIFKRLVERAEEWAREEGLSMMVAATRYRKTTKIAKGLGWTPLGIDFMKEV